jgi:hypothetical protein
MYNAAVLAYGESSSSSDSSPASSGDHPSSTSTDDAHPSTWDSGISTGSSLGSNRVATGDFRVLTGRLPQAAPATWPNAHNRARAPAPVRERQNTSAAAGFWGGMSAVSDPFPLREERGWSDFFFFFFAASKRVSRRVLRVCVRARARSAGPQQQSWPCVADQMHWDEDLCSRARFPSPLLVEWVGFRCPPSRPSPSPPSLLVFPTFPTPSRAKASAVATHTRALLPLTCPTARRNRGKKRVCLRWAWPRVHWRGVVCLLHRMCVHEVA